MGDKNVKKKITILTTSLLSLIPINILAKSNNTKIIQSNYNTNSVIHDVKPINSPSKGTDLYIISFDEIP